MKRTHLNSPTTRRGFTLLEILIVIAIIMVVAAMAVPQLMSQNRQALINATNIKVKDSMKALQFYATQHNTRYPEGGQEIWSQLMQPEQLQDGRTLEPYIKEQPEDAWGNVLYYQYPNEKYDAINEPAIWSAGPDGKDDGGANDDIVSWPKQGQ